MSDVKVSIDALVYACRERDAALAERDALRVRVSELETLTDAPAVAVEMDRLLGLILDAQGEAVRAQQERDRLEREIKTLRDDSRRVAVYSPDRRHLADRLDAILAGGES